MDNDLVLVMIKVRDLVKKYEDSKGQIPISSEEIFGMKSFLRKAEMLGQYDSEIFNKIKFNIENYHKVADEYKIQETLRQRRRRGVRKRT